VLQRVGPTGSLVDSRSSAPPDGSGVPRPGGVCPRRARSNLTQLAAARQPDPPEPQRRQPDNTDGDSVSPTTVPAAELALDRARPPRPAREPGDHEVERALLGVHAKSSHPRGRRRTIKDALGSHLDLQAQLDDAVRRQVEERRRWARVARQEREHQLAPACRGCCGRSSTAFAGRGSTVVVIGSSTTPFSRARARIFGDVGALHEADLADDAEETMAEVANSSEFGFVYGTFNVCSENSTYLLVQAPGCASCGA